MDLFSRLRCCLGKSKVKALVMSRHDVQKEVIGGRKERRKEKVSMVLPNPKNVIGVAPREAKGDTKLAIPQGCEKSTVNVRKHSYMMHGIVGSSDMIHSQSMYCY